MARWLQKICLLILAFALCFISISALPSGNHIRMFSKKERDGKNGDGHGVTRTRRGIVSHESDDQGYVDETDQVDESKKSKTRPIVAGLETDTDNHEGSYLTLDQVNHMKPGPGVKPRREMPKLQPRALYANLKRKRRELNSNKKVAGFSKMRSVDNIQSNFSMEQIRKHDQISSTLNAVRLPSEATSKTNMESGGSKKKTLVKSKKRKNDKKATKRVHQESRYGEYRDKSKFQNRDSFPNVFSGEAKSSKRKRKFVPVIFPIPMPMRRSPRRGRQVVKRNRSNQDASSDVEITAEPPNSETIRKEPAMQVDSKNNKILPIEGFPHKNSKLSDMYSSDTWQKEDVKEKESDARPVQVEVSQGRAKSIHGPRKKYRRVKRWTHHITNRGNNRVRVLAHIPPVLLQTKTGGHVHVQIKSGKKPITGAQRLDNTLMAIKGESELLKRKAQLLRKRLRYALLAKTFFPQKTKETVGPQDFLVTTNEQSVTDSDPETQGQNEYVVKHTQKFYKVYHGKGANGDDNINDHKASKMRKKTISNTLAKLTEDLHELTSKMHAYDMIEGKYRIPLFRSIVPENIKSVRDDAAYDKKSEQVDKILNVGDIEKLKEEDDDDEDDDDEDDDDEDEEEEEEDDNEEEEEDEEDNNNDEKDKLPIRSRRSVKPNSQWASIVRQAFPQAAKFKQNDSFPYTVGMTSPFSKTSLRSGSFSVSPMIKSDRHKGRVKNQLGDHMNLSPPAWGRQNNGNHIPDATMKKKILGSRKDRYPIVHGTNVRGEENRNKFDPDAADVKGITVHDTDPSFQEAKVNLRGPPNTNLSLAAANSYNKTGKREEQAKTYLPQWLLSCFVKHQLLKPERTNFVDLLRPSNFVKFRRSKLNSSFDKIRKYYFFLSGHHSHSSVPSNGTRRVCCVMTPAAKITPVSIRQPYLHIAFISTCRRHLNNRPRWRMCRQIVNKLKSAKETKQWQTRKQCFRIMQHICRFIDEMPTFERRQLKLFHTRTYRQRRPKKMLMLLKGYWPRTNLTIAQWRKDLRRLCSKRFSVLWLLSTIALRMRRIMNYLADRSGKESENHLLSLVVIKYSKRNVAPSVDEILVFPPSFNGCNSEIYNNPNPFQVERPNFHLPEKRKRKGDSIPNNVHGQFDFIIDNYNGRNIIRNKTSKGLYKIVSVHKRAVTAKLTEAISMEEKHMAHDFNTLLKMIPKSKSEQSLDDALDKIRSAREHEYDVLKTIERNMEGEKKDDEDLLSKTANANLLIRQIRRKRRKRNAGDEEDENEKEGETEEVAKGSMDGNGTEDETILDKEMLQRMDYYEGNRERSKRDIDRTPFQGLLRSDYNITKSKNTRNLAKAFQNISQGNYRQNKQIIDSNVNNTSFNYGSDVSSSHGNDPYSKRTHEKFRAPNSVRDKPSISRFKRKQLDNDSDIDSAFEEAYHKLAKAQYNERRIKLLGKPSNIRNTEMEKMSKEADDLLSSQDTSAWGSHSIPPVIPEIFALSSNDEHTPKRPDNSVIGYISEGNDVLSSALNRELVSLLSETDRAHKRAPVKYSESDIKLKSDQNSPDSDHATLKISVRDLKDKSVSINTVDGASINLKTGTKKETSDIDIKDTVLGMEHDDSDIEEDYREVGEEEENDEQDDEDDDDSMDDEKQDISVDIDDEEKDQGIEVDDNGHPQEPEEEFAFLEKPILSAKSSRNDFSWGEWSSCSTSCGIGQRFRSNLCDQNLPCTGNDASTEMELCGGDVEC